jgi:hypothetical protein
MRIKTNITATLRKNLFDSPNPTKHGKEFRDLHSFIFPNKELFISFLEEENFEQQTYYAENILLRLSYDSLFPPPTRLLFNTLSMESEVFGEKKTGYIGRDHFVHLIHLYLLGVYSLFYHQILNENIFVYFRNNRNTSNILSNHLSQSVIKDIIVAWRYFVLYHDISYPIENYLGKNDFDNNHKELYLKAYNNTPKSIGKDLSLRGLSKIIGVSKLIKNKSEYNFENLIKPYLKDEQLSDFSIFDLSKLQQLEKIYGFETIRTVYSVFGKERIVPVLYDKIKMVPLAAYIYSNSDEYKLYKTTLCNTTTTLSTILKSIDPPYNNDCIQSSNYSWFYFVDTYFTVDKIVETFFVEMPLDAFDKTIEYIQSLTSHQYSMVISDTSFKQYCFDIYLVLYKMAGYLRTEDNSSQLNYTNYLSDVVTDFAKDIPIRISDVLKSLLIEKLDNVDFEKDMDSKGSLDDVIYHYLKLISRTYKGLASEIALPLNLSMQLQYEAQKNIKKIRNSLGNKFINNEVNNKLFIDIKNDELDYSKLTSLSNEKLETILEYLNSKAKRTNLVQIEDLFNYKPKFKNIRPKYFDHGVSSCFVFLSTVDIYKQLKSIGEDTFKIILKISLGIDFEKDTKYVDHKFNSIFCETAFAILIHNIRPDFLIKPLNQYRTKLENNPFSYFCILMDSLQQWDRKFQVNQAYNTLPYNSVSKSFNIEIKNNKFRISDFSSRMDIRRSLINLKTGIDNYLYKASDLIELNLGEY